MWRALTFVQPKKRLIFALGLLSLLPYLAAWHLGDLRQHTVGFQIIFFSAFGLYWGMTALAARPTPLDPSGRTRSVSEGGGSAAAVETLSGRDLGLVFGLAILFQGLLIFTPPTLSDDMYRYIWDGRIQAQGLNPYRYPPNAPEVTYLRDEAIWPYINRKAAVTVYPPAAQMAYALLWRIWPDNVRWFQLVIAGSGLLAGLLLVGLLQALGYDRTRVLIYLWSPLLAFETAHAAHVDGLLLPLLAGAWWARVKERDSLVGILLGLGTAIKFYPAFLLPALWRPHHPQGRWRLPLAFGLTILAAYLPYLLTYGSEVIGFLPNYLREQFNIGPLVKLLLWFFGSVGFDPNRSVTLLLLTILASIGLSFVVWPAKDGETAVRRCIWLIGAYTLLSYNLFSWYLLWLLPLLALFVQSGQGLGLRADAWTGWWLFSGLVGLSYTFFIHWKPIPLPQWLEFLPLYLFLGFDLARRLTRHSPSFPSQRGEAAFSWKNFRAYLKGNTQAEGEG